MTNFGQSRRNTTSGPPVKMNNDIRQLARPGQIRLVNLDLDSPRMQEAMKTLGYEKEDLDTRKRKDDFYEENDGMPSPGIRNPKAASKELKFISPGQVEDELIKLRFKHYQDCLMDRINRVL